MHDVHNLPHIVERVTPLSTLFASPSGMTTIVDRLFEFDEKDCCGETRNSC
jgi:hypothetical protein